MLGRPIVVRRRSKSEAEKPFWISYADLMTALMVLFLVAMSVAMMAVTNTVKDLEQKKDVLQQTANEVARQNEALQRTSQELAEKNDQLQVTTAKLRELQKTPKEIETERLKAQREKEISQLLDEIEKAALSYPGVKVDKNHNTIDFGDRARFGKLSYFLTPDQARLLRAFAPEVLAIARDELGRKWLKQIVVVGFASPEGDYLYNLNLSLQRSQRVLCVLLAQPYADETAMSQAEHEQVRDLFLVGGNSFNSTKYNATTESFDESRRVEFRLDFLGIGELTPSGPSIKAAARGKIGKCALVDQ